MIKKTLNKPGIEGNFLNLLKGIYRKPIANLILNSETESILLKWRTRQEGPVLSLLLNIVLEGLARVIFSQGRNKRHQNWSKPISIPRWYDHTHTHTHTPGALGWPRGMVCGGRQEGGSGWGTRVHPWQMHVDVWQNQYNIIKLKINK